MGQAGGHVSSLNEADRRALAEILRIQADKDAGKPAPRIETIDYTDSPFFKLLKKDVDFSRPRKKP